MFFQKKPIHEYYPAMIRLTKVATEIAPGTERAQICSDFVSSAIRKMDIALPANAHKVLEATDFEYISTVLKFIPELQSSDYISEQYRLLLDKIEAIDNSASAA